MESRQQTLHNDSQQREFRAVFFISLFARDEYNKAKPAKQQKHPI